MIRATKCCRCPRGQFSVNLEGTGLVVDKETVWVEEGHLTASNISRDQVRSTLTPARFSVIYGSVQC